MDIAKVKLPIEVMDQPVYKAKVVFLGVDRASKEYDPVKDFEANCHRYRIVDGEIAYLPKEAYSALMDAVIVTTHYKNKKQREEGIDHDDPEDLFEKRNNPRYDITILETYTQGIDKDGNRVFISASEEQTKDHREAEKRAKAQYEEDLRIKIRTELEAEFEERLAAEKAKMMPIPEGVSNEQVQSLTGGDE